MGEMTPAMKALQAKLESQAGDYRKVQTDINTNHQNRQKLTQQMQENEMVKSELERLDEEAGVYKLVGPILIKQDLVEAKSNVDKRLEYMGEEMKRLDGGLKTLEKSQTDKKEEIMQMQQQMQKLQAQAAKAAA
mmetsp:Transcript_2219/g.2461  ORF Transcript_2219/g.2461 Transcript_2219/m.2461 type:complete len:134 (-) Transcript_2219:329-730(-)|eukprot:CAMPEP_0197847398 /NCGR_PEP_ID=MMETSP1438-20131217/5970_1 /TAXON_ID=1461541 /ORGANISM="Pterosperma sp., Strain CCMP1384" /LENGTH=133 /DNA_ID=CAMNT_0043459303 /DNA_START=95 /DNA_END=496 /DNA_ORIENTATION=+